MAQERTIPKLYHHPYTNGTMQWLCEQQGGDWLGCLSSCESGEKSKGVSEVVLVRRGIVPLQRSQGIDAKWAVPVPAPPRMSELDRQKMRSVEWAEKSKQKMNTDLATGKIFEAYLKEQEAREASRHKKLEARETKLLAQMALAQTTHMLIKNPGKQGIGHRDMNQQHTVIGRAWSHARMSRSGLSTSDIGTADEHARKGLDVLKVMRDALKVGRVADSLVGDFYQVNAELEQLTVAVSLEKKRQISNQQTNDKESK